MGLWYRRRTLDAAEGRISLAFLWVATMERRSTESDIVMKHSASHKPIRDFSEEVAAAVQKRSRSIKHRGAKLESSRVKEIHDGDAKDSHRLDIDISHRVASRSVLCRLIVWDDRWVWVDVRRSSKSGWVWSTTIEGRFVGAGGAREVVQNIEKTIDAAWRPDETAGQEVERIWTASLARGPKVVR
jgi:hypothetical protein